MTEQEMTKAAILKATADKIGTSRIEESVKAAKTVKESKPEAKEPEDKKQKVDIKKYPFNVKLGKNKEVNFKPWTGKTKKKFTKIFRGIEDMNDVDLDQVVQVLILDNISNPELYLSEPEQQYLMSLLRKESIKDQFEFEEFCEHCDEVQTIKTSITKAVKYTPSALPTYDDNLKIRFVDIPTKKTLDDLVDKIITNNSAYDGLTVRADIETSLHLEFKNKMTPLQILDVLEELPLNKLGDVLDELKRLSSSIKTEVNKNCTACGKESIFSIQEIPGLYETLMA